MQMAIVPSIAIALDLCPHCSLRSGGPPVTRLTPNSLIPMAAWFSKSTALEIPRPLPSTSLTYASQQQGLFTFYNPTAIQSPDGTSLALTYDGAGNVSSLTDQAGKVFTRTYNSRGQVLTAASPTGGVTTFAYNNDGTAAS